MARERTEFVCTACGAVSPRWAGRCATCGAWGGPQERPSLRRPSGMAPPGEPVALADVASGRRGRLRTGLDELDGVLGGGLVAGSVSLLGGEPGIGKSTLVLQVAAGVAGAGAGGVLVVCGEEAPEQVRARADRLGVDPHGIWLAPVTDVAAVVAQIEAGGPHLVVVDSVQTLRADGVAGGPGSITQVRACSQALTDVARRHGPAVVLVGHVTKDGTLAGPRALEHVVDTVLSFEGDRHHGLRLLRAVKHRHGPTGALGVLEMTGTGLRGVPDASGLLLADRCAGVPGSIVVPTLDGLRPLLVEVQALVAPGSTAVPRRATQGLDGARLALLLAVLEQRAGIVLRRADVFVSAVGGVRLREPGSDLGVALAVASAAVRSPIPADLVACAEVGLAGELRQVAHTDRRLAEAVRLGSRWAVVPPSVVDAPPGLHLLRVPHLRAAVRAAGLDGSLVDARVAATPQELPSVA